MPFEHEGDPASLYDALRCSFVGLLSGMSNEQLATPVPATPAWAVVDVLAHVVGIASDLNHGRFGQGMSGEEWTAAQVESRRGRSVDELAAEWEAEAPKFVDGLRALGYPFGSHYLGDLLQHVADVRHALGLRPPPDDETLLLATDFYLDSFDESLRKAALGTVVITTDNETIEAGVGEVVAELSAGRYELFRALGGRRSERQIRGLNWRGDLDRVVLAVSRYPLPVDDITESPDR